MENEDKKLSESVEKLATTVTKVSTLHRSFLQGIFFGLGSAIGAGIVAAILVGAFNWFIHSVNGVPVLRNIEKVQLQK